MSSANKKRNKKQIYKKLQADSKKTNELKDGITGFLVTCEANREKRCVKECFNILNEAVESVYPDFDPEDYPDPNPPKKKQKTENPSANLGDQL